MATMIDFLWNAFKLLALIVADGTLLMFLASTLLHIIELIFGGNDDEYYE